ncbi:CGNR zinc finger domain-containing protein [Pseudonocardia sp. GCM10023141]|uniref:CGNR zinc finger domain-containing protein n=1 Tax=Pseudonocardia sp. GCM10023141 TaxID=3252653 RepID=UPI0036112363
MEALQTPDRGLHLAVALVNTRTHDPEQLVSPAALRRFLLHHGELEPVDVDAADLAAMIAVRERIRPAFHVPPDAAAALVNDLLAAFAVRPYLSDHDGTAWHLHATRPDASWAEWAAATAALGIATFAAAHGFAALALCAAEDCERVFVNPAPRRVRLFCTPTCASRTRVASFRARRKGESQEGEQM